MKVYIVGVGPGNPEYLTEKVKKIIKSSDIIVGYKYTLNTIKHLILNKDVRYVTLKTQDEVYNQVFNEIKDTDKICTIPFTGDASFSESEIITKLEGIFGDKIIIEPGISAVQVAAARSKLALDKCVLITFHVTGSIEEEKRRLINALKDGKNVIMLPRPWDFMPKNIVEFLKDNGIKTNQFDVEVYEYLTLENEMVTKGSFDQIMKEYSDLSVMVIKHKNLIL